MDITETPHAEDFMMEVHDLVRYYVDAGMKRPVAEFVFKSVLEDFPKKRKPIKKKNTCTHACLACFGGPCKKEI
jgi:hypothetical protein